MTLKPLSAVLILLISGISAFSQNDYRLMFLGKPELPSENLNHFIQHEVIDSKEVYAGYYYRIIQFYQIPSAAEKAQIELQGIRLLDYFPKNAFQAAIPVNYPKQPMNKINR